MAINIEITGLNPDVSVRKNMHGDIWIDLCDGDTVVTIDPRHVRALADALAQWLNIETLEAAE